MAGAYRYGPAWENRLAPSIADLIARAGDIQARGVTDAAAAQAQGAQASGNAWAGAVQNIGNTFAAIPGQMRAAKAAEQESTLRDLQVKDAQRKNSDIDAFDKAFQTPGGMENVIKALPGHLQGQVQKQFLEAQELGDKVKKTRNDLKQTEFDYMAHLGATIRDHGYDPTAAQLALSHAKTVYGDEPSMLQHIDQLRQTFQDNPDQIKSITDAVISSSPKQQELDIKGREATARETTANTGARVADARIPLLGAEAAAAQLKVEDAPTERALKAAQLNEINAKLNGTLPISAKDRAELQIQRDRLTAEQKHWGNEDAVATQAPTLTEDALNLTAKQYAMTGNLPPMGMGKQGANVRSQIINRAAGMYKDLDLPAQVAAYNANKQSLAKATATLDTVAGFEKVAGKNLDNFLSLADKIPDTGMPWLNKPIRELDASVVGSTNVAAFNAARDVALREIARVTSDPKLSGALTDSARSEVQSLSPKDATFAQIKAVAKVLKQDMANVHDGLSAQIGDIQSRIATPPGGKAAAPETKSTEPAKPADSIMRILGR